MIMKRLLLLRHAKSDWNVSGLDDGERPLAPRGIKAARAMAAVLGQAARKSPGLDAVFCSPAQRARETLDLVRDALPDGVSITEETGFYVFEPEPLLARLCQLPDTLGAVLVVGHNPALERLSLTIAAPHSDPRALENLRLKYPTAALAEFEIPASWNNLHPRNARLVQFVRPRDLK